MLRRQSTPKAIVDEHLDALNITRDGLLAAQVSTFDMQALTAKRRT